MDINYRINAFSLLGRRIKNLTGEELDQLADEAHRNNPWFIPEFTRIALNSIGTWLDQSTLEPWRSRYPVPKNSLDIGLVMAGNIPLVGFHDFMAVILSGHRAIIKPSSKDEVLIQTLINWILEDAPDLASEITIAERLNHVEGVIATGSNNTARYFKHYFSHVPNLIRQSRCAVAILDGNETQKQLELLTGDILTYFGLGCRNVSKIFIPYGYDLKPLLDEMIKLNHIAQHHKYLNNYDYNKTIYLVNKEPHLDCGFHLLKESESLFSPLAVTFFEFYKHPEESLEKLKALEDQIQCVVGSGPNMVPFGSAQHPGVDDYADGVDTMEFLTIKTQ